VVSVLTTDMLVLDRYRIMAPPHWGDAAVPTALAVDQRLGLLVDLVLAPDACGTPRGDLFARRARAIAMLQHPTLPVGLEMGLWGGHVVLVYQHREGQVLADIAEEELGDWTGHRVLQLVADLAAALGLAHARGVCHGSFNARGVLVESDGMITIRDLVWPPPLPTIDRMDVAPEVWDGREPTPRADVFALGRMMQRLMRSGGRGTQQQGDSLVDDVAAVAAVAAKATMVLPQARYADGTALAQTIDHLMSIAPHVEAHVGIQPTREVGTRQQAEATTSAAAIQFVATNPYRDVHAALLPLAMGVALALLPLVSAVARDTIGHDRLVVGPATGWTDERGRGGWQDPSAHGEGRSEAPPGWERGSNQPSP